MVKKTNTDALLAHIIEGVEEVKGEDINILDLREIENNVCQYFVVCSGNSNTQVRAISSSVQKVVSKALHEKPWHVEGQGHKRMGVNGFCGCCRAYFSETNSFSLRH